MIAVRSGARIPHLGDPYIDLVLLLLHGNGANNGSVFPDNSQYARTVTRINSDVFTSTAQSIFNGSSIFGQNNGSGFLTISMPQMAGRNWCFETFVRRSAAFDRFGIWYVSSNLHARIDGAAADSSYKFRVQIGGVAGLSSATAIPADTWTHLAVTCQQGAGADNTVRLFVGGNLDHEVESSNSNLDLSLVSSLAIGRFDTAGFYQIAGYLAEYRVTLATRYTQNFVPPSRPFPNAP